MVKVLVVFFIWIMEKLTIAHVDTCLREWSAIKFTQNKEFPGLNVCNCSVWVLVNREPLSFFNIEERVYSFSFKVLLNEHLW